MARRAFVLGAVLLSILTSECVRAAGESRPLQISFSLSPTLGAPAGKTLPVKLRAVRVAGDPGEAAQEWSCEAPGQRTVDLPAGSAWRLTVEAPGIWAPEALLQVGGRSPVAFHLLPTGTLTGRALSPPKDLKSVEVRFKSPPHKGGDEIQQTVLDCPLHGERWECQIPAATLDIRLRAEGFIPRYHWSVTVRPGGRTDLGPFDLVRGASLVGWVRVEGSVPPGQGPSVELLPAVMGAVTDRLSQRSQTTRPTERGFFQLTGVPSGAVIVTARLSGFSPARSQPLTIHSGSEVELRDPLVLAPPLPLEVQFHPPLDPYRQPWHIELMDPGPSLTPSRFERAAEGVADLQGVFRKEGLAPGRYMLFVRDMAQSHWYDDWIEIAPGQAPLEIQFDLLTVEGRLTADKKPLEATLWFTRPEGTPRIRFDADAKGEFSGALPREGEWWVDLELPTGGVSALPPVEVKRAPGSSVAHVDIRVPDTRLAVQVKDEAGKPVPGAQVIVFAVPPRERRRQIDAITDESGELLVRGLGPGAVQVFAHKETASSDWLTPTLAEEAQDPPLSLVLREKVRLSGRIVAPEGPLPGARVLLVPAIAPGAEGWVGQGLSEADGRFQVLLDRYFPGGCLAVFPPGFAARLMPAPTLSPPPQDLAIPVSQEGGDLRVDGRDLGKQGLYTSQILHDGVRVPLWTFVREGRGVKDAEGWYTLSLLEPGSYSFCLEAGACDSGFLAANGELKLSVGGAGQSRGGKGRTAGPGGKE